MKSSTLLAAEQGLLTTHLSLVLEAGRMGIWEWDLQTSEVAWSPTLERLLGMEEGTFAGTFEAFVRDVHPADRAGVLETIERSVRERSDHYVEYRVTRRDGAIRWLEGRGRFLLDENGEPRRLLGVCSDVTERKESMLRLQVSEALHSATLLSVADAVVTTDPDGRVTLLNGVAEAITGWSLGDARGRAFDEIVRFAPGPEETERRVSPSERNGDYPEPRSPKGSDRARTTKTLVRRDGTKLPVDESTAPIRTSSGDVVGRVVVLRDVTAECQEQARRQFISEASELLTSTLDFEKTLGTIARLAVSRIADGCAVHCVLPDGNVRRLFVAYRDAAHLETAHQIKERFVPDPSFASGAASVVRTGKSIFVAEITPELIARSSVNSEHRQLLDAMNLRSFMVVALRAGARTLGAISLIASGSSRFDEHDLLMAEELGRRAGMAMENAALYEGAQRARLAAEKSATRTALIQEVTAALSDAPTSTLVAEVVMSLGSKAIRASAVALFELAASGDVCNLVRSFGYSGALVDAYRTIPLSVRTPLSEAVKSGRPLFFSNREAFDRDFPGILESMPSYASWAALPLVVEGRTLGALGISFGEAREFDEEERDFIVTLSRLCAHALDRAKLYDSETRARAQAEFVRRAHENLLTVVSHDLRNPLSAIAITASILTKTDGGRDAAKVAKCADNILRATHRMDRLIADLLDLAKMESGRLVVELEVHDVNCIVRESVDVLSPLASRNDLSLRSELPAFSPTVRCDRERVLQVLSNLLGNALKFTPPGGTVGVVCEVVEGTAQIAVSDTGCGIAETEMPHIFERYWQAKSGAHDGIGLGLSIARGLVEAQGGRIWVESQIDRGTTFYFTLPLEEKRTPSDTKIKSFVGL